MTLQERATTLERVERYVIEPGAQGIVLRMRQGRRALGVACFSLAVLLASWWFGPYGPRPASGWARPDLLYWLWSGFFSVVFVLGLLGAVYKEDWTITEQELVVTKSVGPWRTTRRVSKGRRLRIRIEVNTGGGEGTVFPYRLSVLDAEGSDSGLRLELQRTRNVDRVLDALRSVLTLDVDDLRESDKPLA